jgi:GWxTD domain-containing protein
MNRICSFRRILAPAVVLLFVVTGIASGQGVESISMERSKFFIDYAVFADSAGNRLEIYYKIFNDGLKYIKRGDKFIADYEVNVIVVGDGDEQITGRSIERNYVLESYELTRSNEGYLINQLDLSLPSGDFELVAKLIDHNSNDVSTIETGVRSPDFDRGGDLSQVEFIQAVATVPDDSPFNKNGVVALPVVERSLDSEANELGLYLELYAADYLGKSVRYDYVIHGDHDDFELYGSEEVDVDAAVVPLRKFIAVDELLPGEYKLDFKLSFDNKPLAERQARFIIKWSLTSLLRNDFDYAVRQLKYIIDDDEKKKLLALPDSARLRGFEEWWRSKDPIRETPENELREEYYRRIRYANQYYSTVSFEGWETDRGMIYIRFGEPDQIDRYPFELDRKPYQIWRYYAQRRTFVFEDTRGDGDFQLQQPYDGDWRHIGTGLGP